MHAIAFFVAGLAFGSFLNVCVSRIPRDLSIVTPRSCCPRCNAPIAWYDNIPIVSWSLLHGRCRHCQQAISIRYPAVELLTAILFVATYASFGFTATALKACILCFLVVGLIFMDAETGYLPAEFTYPGIALGLLFAWLVGVDTGGSRFMLRFMNWPMVTAAPTAALLDAILAIVFCAGFFYLAWAAYYLVRKRDGLGFGDIAFIAMIAAFLGLKLTLLVVFLAPLLGTLYALGRLAIRPSRLPQTAPEDSAAKLADDRVPPASISFGVFLGISALIALFFGDPIWRWYLAAFY
ncbi:MAG TPA: prepilin peptidase [Candidatus Angelobacter sp.]|nr:prepilin peptidase [Candidatus Angelobacter sp.]